MIIDLDISVHIYSLILLISTLPQKQYFALSSVLQIIILSGKNYSESIAASLIIGCNLNKLIIIDFLEYESLAYELATNKQKLRKINEKLRNKNNSSFFDYSRFTKDLELIYSNIIHK